MNAPVHPGKPEQKPVSAATRAAAEQQGLYALVDRLSNRLRTKADIALIMDLDRILDAQTLDEQTAAFAVVFKKIAAARGGAQGGATSANAKGA